MTIDDLEAGLRRAGATTFSAWREHKGRKLYRVVIHTRRGPALGGTGAKLSDAIRQAMRQEDSDE